MKNSCFLLLFIVLLNSCTTENEIKRQQYFVEGLELYKTHCANCHQLDGSGLAGLYPTIKRAALYNGNKIKLICLIQNGTNTKTDQKAEVLKQKMPANKELQAIELAEITTYITNKWGNQKVITDIEEVKKALSNCK
jgi:mono/diheme cytochrome c family protein